MDVKRSYVCLFVLWTGHMFFRNNFSRMFVIKNWILAGQVLGRRERKSYSLWPIFCTHLHEFDDHCKQCILQNKLSTKVHLVDGVLDFGVNSFSGIWGENFRLQYLGNGASLKTVHQRTFLTAHSLNYVTTEMSSRRFILRGLVGRNLKKLHFSTGNIFHFLTCCQDVVFSSRTILNVWG